MPTKLPRLTQVTAPPGLRLALVFADGWETTVDLDAFITSFPSLAPLADPARFAAPALEEWGSGVTWDDEGPLSLAATTLYRLASEQAGDDRRRFEAWLLQHGLSNAKAAEALGMTRRSIISYRTGSRPIPKTVWLACLGLSCSQGHPGDHGGPRPARDASLNYP